MKAPCHLSNTAKKKTICEYGPLLGLFNSYLGQPIMFQKSKAAYQTELKNLVNLKNWLNMDLLRFPIRKMIAL